MAMEMLNNATTTCRGFARVLLCDYLVIRGFVRFNRPKARDRMATTTNTLPIPSNRLHSDRATKYYTMNV